MSTLIVDELNPGVVFSQTIKIKRNTLVRHIRPWIYKQGTLIDGDFKLEVYDGATLLATDTINYTEINSGITGTYAHGFIRFDFDPLQLNVPEINDEKEYILKFSMINSTLDTINFIAISRQYERKIYPTYGDVDGSGEAFNDMIEPCGVEIYEYIGA